MHGFRPSCNESNQYQMGRICGDKSQQGHFLYLHYFKGIKNQGFVGLFMDLNYKVQVAVQVEFEDDALIDISRNGQQWRMRMDDSWGEAWFWYGGRGVVCGGHSHPHQASTQHREALQNQISSLLPLASCHLHLNSNPFHYVAPANVCSTDQSRFLDDRHQNCRRGMALAWNIWQVCRAFPIILVTLSAKAKWISDWLVSQLAINAHSS